MIIACFSAFILFGLPLLQFFIILSIPLLFLSIIGSINQKDIRIFPYLLVVIPAQIIGYGTGFIQAFIRRFLFKHGEITGFKKNYYK